MRYSSSTDKDAQVFAGLVGKQKRKQAGRMWQLNRYTNREIGDQFGIHYLTIRWWSNHYETDGKTALLSAKAQGHPVGPGRPLSTKREAPIQKQLIGKPPNELKPRYAPWARDADQQPIVDQMAIKLMMSTVPQYLKSCGFTGQHPKTKGGRTPACGSTALPSRINACYSCTRSVGKCRDLLGDETGLGNDFPPAGDVRQKVTHR